MFSKQLKDLSRQDIEQLFPDEIRESEVSEFKEALPGRHGPDAWHTGAEHVGNHARNVIVREIVAFANARGGTLVLGIKESDDHPSRAVAIQPIPRCAELATRIAMFCRDMIEPQIPQLEIREVPIEGDSGVVVVRVSRSRSAPHRSRASLQCYVRRAERTENLTMRKIQDLTLLTERGMAAVDRRFDERSKAIAAVHLRSTALALRATCVPLTPLYVPGIPGDPNAYLVVNKFQGSVSGGPVHSLQIPIVEGQWRPILRGARSEAGPDATSLRSSRLEIHQDGLLEFQFRIGHRESAVLPSAWYMALACNALSNINRVRGSAAAASVEYGLEMEIHIVGPSMRVLPYSEKYDTFGPLYGRHVMPRYSVGECGEFPALATLIEADFWNAAGRDLRGGGIAVVF